VHSQLSAVEGLGFRSGGFGDGDARMVFGSRRRSGPGSRRAASHAEPWCKRASAARMLYWRWPSWPASPTPCKPSGRCCAAALGVPHAPAALWSKEPGVRPVSARRASAGHRLACFGISSAREVSGGIGGFEGFCAVPIAVVWVCLGGAELSIFILKMRLFEAKGWNACRLLD
jgi:hypothetical protein